MCGGANDGRWLLLNAFRRQLVILHPVRIGPNRFILVQAGCNVLIENVCEFSSQIANGRLGKGKSDV